MGGGIKSWAYGSPVLTMRVCKPSLTLPRTHIMRINFQLIIVAPMNLYFSKNQNKPAPSITIKNYKFFRIWSGRILFKNNDNFPGPSCNLNKLSTFDDVRFRDPDHRKKGVKFIEKRGFSEALCGRKFLNSSLQWRVSFRQLIKKSINF